MSDMEDKIKNLLDSPEGLNQIINTARTLFGDAQQPAEKTQSEENAQKDEEVIVQAVKSEDENILEKLDPKVISTAMQVMDEYRKTDDRRIQILHALRSYFKNEDQIHITKAIQLVKLSKIAKRALNSIREEDSFV